MSEPNPYRTWSDRELLAAVGDIFAGEVKNDDALEDEIQRRVSDESDADHARAVELRDAWLNWCDDRGMERLQDAIRAILDAHGLRLEGG